MIQIRTPEEITAQFEYQKELQGIITDIALFKHRLKKGLSINAIYEVSAHDILRALRKEFKADLAKWKTDKHDYKIFNLSYEFENLKILFTVKK